MEICGFGHKPRVGWALEEFLAPSMLQSKLSLIDQSSADLYDQVQEQFGE
jgi:hypothetical protein